MINFEDIAGLGKALKRLTEVIAEGIGGVSRPILTRKNADAKAYEIRTIIQAFNESQKLLGNVKYDGGVIVIESGHEKVEPELPEVSFEKRVTSRTTFQEAKRQLNLESIAQHAAGEFEGTEEIGPDRPDSDWISRFFRIAEDISTEQMQALWGKILAGEVKRPGSYSLRTLDILKNISQKEAETFVKLARLSFIEGEKAFVPYIDGGKYLEKHFGISFLDILLLREVGFLSSGPLAYELGDNDTHSILRCGTTCVVVDRPVGSPKLSLEVEVITNIGRELLQLVEPSPAAPNYIEAFVNKIKVSPHIAVNFGTIEELLIDGIAQQNELSEVSGNQ